jgi:hypothetical protein
MGGPTSADFVYGADAIATSVARGGNAADSPFNWSADTAFVASSGDFAGRAVAVHRRVAHFGGPDA